jgi:predicted rRNA methylase YqxC with S4 and FtsJ domains
LSRFVENEEIPEIKKYFFDISNGTVSFIEVEKILAELKDVSKKILLVIKVLFFYLIMFCIGSIVVV